MMHTFIRKLAGFICVFVVTASFMAPAYAETVFGASPTGVFEMPGTKYPVYLIVPDNYEPDKNYPFIVALSDRGQSLETAVDFWKGTAKRRSMIVLVPTMLWPDDLPTNVDEWIFNLMDDVRSRYRISEERTYLVGLGEGAHYAAYLGVNYPEKFAGAGLMGQAWPGQFEKLMRLKSSPEKQIPFIVSLEADDSQTLVAVKKSALNLDSKGYPIHFIPLEGDEEFKSRNFQLRLISLLDEKSEAWKHQSRGSNKTMKQKFGNWLERNIKV